MRRRSEERENHQEYKKGLWTVEEDNILIDYVQAHGTGLWNRIVRKTGLSLSLSIYKFYRSLARTYMYM